MLLTVSGQRNLLDSVSMRGEPTHIVAVVDDDADVRSAIAGLVRSMGFGVRQFASGIEFLQSHDVQDTACLITDVRMPILSGVELHDRMLALGYMLPTIFITAFPTPSLYAKLNEAGVVAILAKPLDANVIADCIESAIGMP
jgi:FixJ family two-component response regulator